RPAGGATETSGVHEARRRAIRCDSETETTASGIGAHGPPARPIGDRVRLVILSEVTVSLASTPALRREGCRGRCLEERSRSTGWFDVDSGRHLHWTG